MSEIDEFLTDVDDAKDSEGYIKPNIEVALAPNKRQECREIVKEIKQFGVSQRQITYIIYLLSLEIENLELMKGLTALVGEHRDNVPLVPKDKNITIISGNTEEKGEEGGKKLILPTS